MCCQSDQKNCHIIQLPSVVCVCIPAPHLLGGMMVALWLHGRNCLPPPARDRHSPLTAAECCHWPARAQEHVTEPTYSYIPSYAVYLFFSKGVFCYIQLATTDILGLPVVAAVEAQAAAGSSNTPIQRDIRESCCCIFLFFNPLSEHSSF